MEKFASELQQNLSLTADYEHPFAQAMKWLLDKINLCLWCMTNLSISPNCNPKFILELCTEQPSILLAIKKITGLRHLCDREEFLSLLASQSDQSLDLFLGFSAIVKVVDYLFSFNKGTKQVADISVEVEQLLDSILKPESAELSLQLLEDMFSLFFLRRDDVSFQETASDSGGSDGAAEHVPSGSSSASLVKADSSMKSKLSSDPSASNNSNSPSSTQTASSVALSSKNKSDISLGFLCQRPDKLQVPYSSVTPSACEMSSAIHLYSSCVSFSLEARRGVNLGRIRLERQRRHEHQAGRAPLPLHRLSRLLYFILKLN